MNNLIDKIIEDEMQESFYRCEKVYRKMLAITKDLDEDITAHEVVMVLMRISTEVSFASEGANSTKQKFTKFAASLDELFDTFPESIKKLARKHGD